MAGNDAGNPRASEYLQVQTTTDSRAEAMELAAGAVRARLAACGQVAGPVASTYWWNDEIERAEEWFVFFKLPADRYPDLAAFIAEHHSYDEPEIVATPLVAGSPTFFSWLVEETRPASAASGSAASVSEAGEPDPGGDPGGSGTGESGTGESGTGEADVPRAREPGVASPSDVSG
jgi:periplasmic divalent cation tolerance protein